MKSPVSGRGELRCLSSVLDAHDYDTRCMHGMGGPTSKLPRLYFSRAVTCMRLNCAFDDAAHNLSITTE